jgi:hypothetical protein
MIRRLRWTILKNVDTRTITVIWMDDREETYPRVETIVRDGVLHIHQYDTKTLKRTAEWHIPTANIRMWYPAGQEPPED